MMPLQSMSAKTGSSGRLAPVAKRQALSRPVQFAGLGDIAQIPWDTVQNHCHLLSAAWQAGAVDKAEAIALGGLESVAGGFLVKAVLSCALDVKDKLQSKGLIRALIKQAERKPRKASKYILSALNHKNLHVRRYAVERLNALPIPIQGKIRGYLTAFDDPETGNVLLARQKAVSLLRQPFPNPELRKLFRQLVASVPVQEPGGLPIMQYDAGTEAFVPKTAPTSSRQGNKAAYSELRREVFKRTLKSWVEGKGDPADHPIEKD